MVLAMVSNTAFAGVANDSDLHSKMIAKTFNEFRYKMTVEVDPNDANFQKNAVTDFKQKLAILQTQGVAPTEIMDYVRTTMLDQSTRNDFDRLMSSVDSNKVSGEEAGNLAMNFMASRYQQGANYSGGQASYKWIMIVVGVVAVGVAAYFLYQYYQSIKTKTNTSTITDTNTNTDTITNTSTDTITDTVTNTDTNTFTNTDNCNPTYGVVGYGGHHHGGGCFNNN